MASTKLEHNGPINQKIKASKQKVDIKNWELLEVEQAKTPFKKTHKDTEKKTHAITNNPLELLEVRGKPANLKMERKIDKKYRKR